MQTCSVVCTRSTVGVLFTVPLWPQSLSGSLLLHSHVGLIKFKATWCDFNLNVNLMWFFFYMVVMCLVERNAAGSDLASQLFLSAAPWFGVLLEAAAQQWCVLGTRDHWVQRQWSFFRGVLSCLPVRGKKVFSSAKDASRVTT